MNKNSLPISLLILGLLLFNCGINTADSAKGGATETINASVITKDTTVTVNVRSKDTVAVEIILIGSEYNPVTKNGPVDSVQLISNSASVKFNSHSGVYNVILREKDKGMSLMFPGIMLGSNSNTLFDTLFDTLSLGCGIRGNVSTPMVNDTVSQNVYVYLVGTTYVSILGTGNTFNFKNVPAGQYTIEATITNGNKLLPRTVSKNIEIVQNSEEIDMTLFFSN